MQDPTVDLYDLSSLWNKSSWMLQIELLRANWYLMHNLPLDLEVKMICMPWHHYLVLCCLYFYQIYVWQALWRLLLICYRVSQTIFQRPIRRIFIFVIVKNQHIDSFSSPLVCHDQSSCFDTLFWLHSTFHKLSTIRKCIWWSLYSSCHSTVKP